jgi:hypothetical protein
VSHRIPELLKLGSEPEGRVMADSVNSLISIADVQNFNGFDEAKVASGHYVKFPFMHSNFVSNGL